MLEDMIAESVAYLKSRLTIQPEVGIVLGSGLNSIADSIVNPIYIPYGDVVHMRPSTNAMHRGRFVCGMLEDVSVICMQGRIHAYEGYTATEIAYPIFVMGALGVKTLVLTNATGGINESFDVGEIVAISDHINFTGMNPLIKAFPDNVAGHCPDMTTVYSKRLRALAREVASQQGLDLKEGVYLGCTGPSFETPAEIRAFRILGADLVGMSTVFEVIAAADCGMEVLGISLVTNMAAGVLDQPITGDEIVEIGSRKAIQVGKLICGIVSRFE